MLFCFNTKFLQICIQNNPEEARQMLLQNPQLAYALLQAQVVMKIVDPVIAQVGFLTLQTLLLYIRLTMKNLIGREHSINSQ